jgi:hypothetical protein
MKASLDYREKIGSISAAMVKIHKLLMENEMELRELALNKTIPPAERLNALLNDPDLAWLREMSRLMAYVDEIYFQKEPILERQLEDIEEKVQALFALQNESEFTYRYRHRLSTIPDLMIEHGHLKVALKKSKSHIN